MRRLILVAAAAAAFCGPAAAQDGGAAFKAKCTSCHTQKKVLDGVRKKPEAERLAHLERFLPGHFAPDPAERKAIADYLVQAAAG
jgi:hypothetical protein